MKKYLMILLTISSTVQAGEGLIYKYRVRPIFGVGETCKVENIVKNSQFKILVQDSFAAPVIVLPVNASLCLKMKGMVKIGYVLPFPHQLFNDINVIVQQKQVDVNFALLDPKLALDKLVGDTARITIVKADASVIEVDITYQKNGKPLTSIGTLKLVFVRPESLTAIPGFDIIKSVPLKFVSFDIPEKGNAVLSADLHKIVNANE